MKVTTVSANIRYSKDTGQGAWKVIELGADATVDANETWQQAQASLYQQLNQSQGGNYILERWQRHGRCKHQCVGSGL